MDNGSASGCDGLATCFYKFFCDQISELVHASSEKAFEEETLSISQRRAILVLLHKGLELPRDVLTNWRPISLTDTDYKILAKASTLRMQSVTKSIIHNNQVGYIKEYIICTIDAVKELINDNNKPGILLGLDYCKAFDSINKNF